MIPTTPSGEGWHRAEDLFLCDHRAVIDADDHGGCHIMPPAEVLGQVSDLAPTDGYRCAVAARPLDRGEHTLLLCGADHRSDKGFRVHRVADRHCRIRRGDVRDGVVEERPVDEHAGRRRARLPRVDADSDRGPQDRSGVRVVEGDRHRLTAQLEEHPLHGVGTLAHQ